MSVMPVPNPPVCDFCSAPNPPHRIGANDFIMATFCSPQLGSKGEWAACDACKQLVVEDRWDELIDRATATFVKKYQVPSEKRPGLRRVIASTYLRLKKNLRGGTWTTAIKSEK